MAFLWNLTVTVGFAWCSKWPKRMRSRRAFRKAAFLTLCLCPSCFYHRADCKRLLPTLHRLIIILISMLPWMCIAEQNLAPPRCESREEPWNSQSVQNVGSPPQRRPLWLGIAPSPFSPRRGGRDKEGFGYRTGNLCLSVCAPQPTEISFVASYSTVWYIPTPRGLRQPRAPAEQTQSALVRALGRTATGHVHLQLHDFLEVIPVSVRYESERDAVYSAADARVTEWHSEETRTALHVPSLLHRGHISHKGFHMPSAVTWYHVPGPYKKCIGSPRFSLLL